MAGKNKIMQAVVSFAGTIDPSLGKAMDNVAGHLDKVNWKAVAVGAAVGGIAVATGKAVVEAGKYLAELGDDYNKAMNQLSASTGATGDELDALGESVKNIYAQNLGEDFNDVAEGLAATQKASDLAGEALEQATAAGFVLRDTFDYDISESARAASALMKNFNISAEEAYGLIATGAQNGADKNGDLLDTLNEYSAQFAALGLSADQFMGSLVEGADAGLFSIDKVADAVKEFNIRAKDGSDSSAEAFKGLGLNSDKMFAAFAAGGETAQAAFFDTVEALNKLEDPLKRNEIGVALFGSQFEDLEAGILPVLGDIETAAYDGAAALQQINDVKYNDLGSAFEAVKRSAEVALLPMASMIANTLTSLAPILTDTFEEISPVITDTLNACMPFVQDFLVGMGDTLKKVMPMVTELAAGILPLLARGLVPAASARPRTAATPTAHADRSGYSTADRQHPCHRAPDADADHLDCAACAGEPDRRAAAGHHPAAGGCPANRQQRHHAAAASADATDRGPAAPGREPAQCDHAAPLAPAGYSGAHRKRARHDRRLGIEDCQLRLRRHQQDRGPVWRWRRRQRQRLRLCDRRLHEWPVHRGRGSALSDRGGHQLQPCVPLAKPVLLGRGWPDAGRIQRGRLRAHQQRIGHGCGL